VNSCETKIFDKLVAVVVFVAADEAAKAAAAFAFANEADFASAKSVGESIAFLAATTAAFANLDAWLAGVNN
jgi:hypothetical protein